MSLQCPQSLTGSRIPDNDVRIGTTRYKNVQFRVDGDVEKTFHKVCVARETYTWGTCTCGPRPDSLVPTTGEENGVIGGKSERRQRSCRTAEGGVLEIGLENGLEVRNTVLIIQDEHSHLLLGRHDEQYQRLRQ